jgi:YXWGXW repeat-containing protein
MNFKKRIAIAAIASIATLGSLAADARVNVEIGVGPPAPQVEVVPAPRAGYVWAPGYWSWRGGRHAWVAGRWIPARRGYRWEPAHWVPIHGHWRFAEGRWVR